jgi:hypothetical protein
MKTREAGKPGRKRGLGRRTAGVLAGLALALVPVFGQTPSSSLSQGQPVPADYGLPSENTAMTLAVVGSAFAVASVFSENGYVALGGLCLGPSLGFMYGGCWGRALLSSGLRFAGTFVALSVLFDDDEDSGGVVTAWLVGMSASIVLDLATVRSAVHKRNAAIMARRGLTVGVSPFALPKGGGLQVRLSF